MTSRKKAQRTPAKRRRKRPRTPELVKKEEMAKNDPFPEPSKPPKRQKRDLLASADKYAKRALERTTIAWHKTCAF